MPDQPPSRPRFRLVRWSLFGLALVGLAFLLEDWLSPWPRRTIAVPPFEVGFLWPDGSRFLTGPRNPLKGWAGTGTIFADVESPCRMWDTQSGRLTGSFFEKEKASYHLLSPSLRYLLVQSESGLYLVDLSTKEQKRFSFTSLPLDRPNIFSPRESFLVVRQATDDDGEKGVLLETATGKLLKTLDGKARLLGFIDDNLFLFKSWDGGWIHHICDIRTGKVLKSFHNIRDPVLSVNGKTLAAVSSQGLIFMDLGTFVIRCVRPLSGIGPESKLAFFPDGKALALFLEKDPVAGQVATGEGIELWDVATGEQRHGDFDRLKNWSWEIFVSRSKFEQFAFSPDSALFALAAATPDGPEVGMWDVASAKLLWTEQIDDYWPVTFTADSQFLIIDPEQKADLLDARTGQRHRILNTGFPRDLPYCEYTRHFGFIIMQSEISRQPNFLEKLLGNWWSKGNAKLQHVRVVEVATGRELARLESESLEQAWLSEDGRTLVTKHNESGTYVMRIWDLPLRKPLLLVIGIPLGLGLLMLFSRWRGRRRIAKLPADSAPG